MKPSTITVDRGVVRGRGKRAGPGLLLRARNSRYLPEDFNRLWALLGRAKYNAVPMLADTGPKAGDDTTVKMLFPYSVDGGTSKMCVLKGGAIFEGDLGVTGTLLQAQHLSSSIIPRGTAVGYLDKVFLTVGRGGWSSDAHAWTRTPAGWRKQGHRLPTATFTATPGHSGGGYTTTYDVQYTYRIYDSTTDTESQHGPVVTVAAFTNQTDVALTFAAGITVTALGTHLRIYKTFMNEPAGLFYRCDGNGNGIALALAVPGYTFVDTSTNDEIALNGRVRADGLEGTNGWAEHGGAPPQANGSLIFDNHQVWWQSTQILYSAKGYLETCPVNSGGGYEYYLPMGTTKQDVVQCCALAGPYLLVMLSTAIIRVLSLPTYAEPGFDRVVEREGTLDHGICGPYAAATFGVGEEEAKFCIYVSREHGPCITNGTRFTPIRMDFDFRSLVEPSRWSSVKTVNNSHRQEVWIGYTPLGGTANTQAIIIDYALYATKGLRITWPIDVKIDDAIEAWGNDGVPRLYLSYQNVLDLALYVQDQGDFDEQKNFNDAGDIRLEWYMPRGFPVGSTRAVKVARAFVSGLSGSVRTFSVVHQVLSGKDLYETPESVEIGPGETVDEYLVNMVGQGHSVALAYTGRTGSTYDQDSESCAPCLAGVDLEISDVSRQGRTRGE